MSAVTPRSPQSRLAFKPGDEVPRTVEFARRNGMHAFAGFLLLVSLVGCAISGYLLWATGDTVHQGILAGCGVMVLLMWGIRAATTPTRVSVSNGILEIARTGQPVSFDLTSRYTVIEVHERPWKVTVAKAGLAPMTITREIVDPKAFMAVLRYYRPEF